MAGWRPANTKTTRTYSTHEPRTRSSVRQRSSVFGEPPNPTRSNGGNNIRILDPAVGVDPSTQTDLGGLNIGTGIIAGGTFGVNMVGVGGDGAIYVGNLQTATSRGGAVYKVYKWANESSTPIVAYSGDAGLPGTRIGDDFAVTGSGSPTRIVSGYSNPSSPIPGTNGYAIIDPTAGTATHVAFASTPPAANDFKYGITFTDATHVIGSQGGATYQYSSLLRNHRNADWHRRADRTFGRLDRRAIDGV